MRKTGYAYSVEKQKVLIRQSIKVQLISVSIIVIIMLMGQGYELAISSFVGGICAIIPNISFAYYCFMHNGAQSAKKIIGSFYFAEMLKFVLVFLLLIVSYTLAEHLVWLKSVGILVGFIATYTSVMLIPHFTK